MTEPVRLSKLMAERGMCSRREADRYIEQGWVRVNGEIIDTLGTRIDPSSTIRLEPGASRVRRRLVTVLLHKPIGYVSAQPEDDYRPAITLITRQNRYQRDPSPLRFHPRHLHGLAPAGRLDIDSHGLLVLTQDGRIARQLIGPDSRVEKEYLVKTEGDIDAHILARLRHGLSLDGRALRPIRVDHMGRDLLRMTLTEGRKRQIRRMCDLVGLKARSLKRVRIGNVRLADLPVGQWRYLSPKETF